MKDDFQSFKKRAYLLKINEVFNKLQSPELGASFLLKCCSFFRQDPLLLLLFMQKEQLRPCCQAKSIEQDIARLSLMQILEVWGAKCAQAFALLIQLNSEALIIMSFA